MSNILYQTGFEADDHGFDGTWVASTAQKRTGSRAYFGSGYAIPARVAEQMFNLPDIGFITFWWRQSGPYTGLKVRNNGDVIFDENYNTADLQTWLEVTLPLVQGENLVRFESEHDSENSASDGVWIDDLRVEFTAEDTLEEPEPPLDQVTSAQYISRGHVIDYISSDDLTAGEVRIVGDLLGIATRDSRAGVLGSLRLTGVFDVAKAPATSFAVGAPVHWDAINRLAVSEASGNRLLGHALAIAAAAASTVRVRLSQ